MKIFFVGNVKFDERTADFGAEKGLKKGPSSGRRSSNLHSLPKGFCFFPSYGKYLGATALQFQSQSIVGPGENFGDKCKVDKIAFMNSEKTEVRKPLFIISNQDIFRIAVCHGMYHAAAAAGFNIDNVFGYLKKNIAFKNKADFIYKRE